MNIIVISSCVTLILIVAYILVRNCRKMKVISDTHIWYELGNNKISFADDKIALVTTYNSIDEFARTENLLRDPEYTRNGIRAMFQYSRNNAIFDPPFIYLKKLAEPQFKYDSRAEHATILEFTERVAKGADIDFEKSVEYREFCKARKNDLEAVSKIFNDQSLAIKANIKNLKKHRTENSIPINRELISRFVGSVSKSEGLPANFDWGLIQLFENVMKVYFNALETGEYESKPNDWYDLFLLIYVQPGTKVWTKETMWLTLIDRCDMNEYLYKS